jgi:MFS family permease
MDLGRTYLKHGLRAQIKELYAADAMREFAISMIAIFEPIYLFKIYGSLQIVFLFYAFLYLIYFFAIPLGALATARKGFEHCISISMLFLLLYYLALAQLDAFPTLLPLVLIFSLLEKTFFRVSYHADMAHYGRRGFRGSEVGGLSFLESIAGMTGPLLGGLVLALFGFNALFLIVSICIFVSVLPMLSTREEFTPGTFSYREALENFFHPQGKYKRTDSLAYMGYGEELITTSFWPIFIFLFLPQLAVIGLLKSAAAIFSSLRKLYFGRLSDELSAGKKRRWVLSNTLIYVGTNLLRPFVNSWLGIFAVNLFADTAKSGIVYPFFTYVYSAAGENRDFLRYAVFYEMSLAGGKVVLGFTVLLLSLLLVGFSFWFIIFLLAGAWSLLYLYLKF